MAALFLFMSQDNMGVSFRARAVATGGHSWAVHQNIFLVSRNICFKYIIKTKIFPT